ncbi:hypothetical protein F373_gp005 [Bacillus phage SP-10]|uniref:hypothetical protein n=1 Tax=Bacillus phage SP10 TaxID=941058 RepID=UPI0002198AD9|nr:hypothetical protein F373_gp005 [Bacillus phage SP-10]BAK52817.1 hypothetical protein [Bacillus phage SP-10]
MGQFKTFVKEYPWVVVAYITFCVLIILIGVQPQPLHKEKQEGTDNGCKQMQLSDNGS